MRTTRYAPTTCARAWLSLALATSLGLTPTAHAAEDDKARITELEQKLDESLKMIRELSNKVEALEAREAQRTSAAGAAAAGTAAAAATASAAVPPGPANPTPTAPVGAATPGAPPVVGPPAPADTGARLTHLEETVSQMANAPQRAEDRGMAMHGFADVGAGTHNAQFPKYQGADIAELDFFLTPQLGARTRALFELNFEVGADGAVGVDLERAQIGYQFSDSATIWLGRFHTPYGFYNTAFHHGQWIAISLRRPRFIEFEDHGGTMPAHTVGLWLTGSQRLGEQRLTYDAWIGNSQRITGGTLDMNNAGVTAGSTMFGGNIGLLMSGVLDGLKVGLDAFQTRIENQDVAPSQFTQVQSYGAYLVYDTDRWEDIAEWHFFDNTDLTGHTGTHHSDAGFLQIGYRGGRFTPYGRYERGSFNQSDPYFAAQTSGNSYDREALGVRFDIDLSSALKMEFAETRYTDRYLTRYGEALLQYAIRF